jgi:glycosyltransferase involved in cell wall biosynthesis
MIGAKLVGRFGRYTAMKDYLTFLTAAGLILKAEPQIHFIAAGPNVDSANQELTAHIAALGINEHVHLLGERNDLPALTAWLDIAVSSSAFGEGFPNVVGEAMASAVPVVATDVGDTAWVLGSTGKLVPPGDARALADACLELLRLPREVRRSIGESGRQRVEEQFSLANAVQQFGAHMHFVL